MDLWNIKTIKYLFDKYNCNFNKSLGQNFLVSQWVCPKMVEMAGVDEKSGVIEIGPGVGVLTVELAKKANKVVAIEVDKKLIPLLDETLSDYKNVEVINSDVLKTDLHKVIEEKLSNQDVIVCANLPYYITSPIIMYLLKSKLPIKSITIMVQKEVARRIVAKECTRDINILSLSIQYYSEPAILFDVSSGNFNPQPDVDSSVISLKLRSEPVVKVKSEEVFFKVINAAFAQRRKTAVNSMANSLGLKKGFIMDLFENVGIDLNKRSENLSMEEFGKISDLLFEYKQLCF